MEREPDQNVKSMHMFSVSDIKPRVNPKGKTARSTGKKYLVVRVQSLSCLLLSKLT